MTDLHAITQAASAEVRGAANTAQRELLAGDVDAWRDALHEVLTDLDRQVVRNAARLEETCAEAPNFADLEREKHARWLSRVTSFRTAVERRLAGIEFDTAVRRRRRLDAAHRQLAAAAADLVDVDDLEDLAALTGEVVVPAGDLLAVHRALQGLIDAADGLPAGALVGSDS
jgi:hypothetical protein